MKRTVTFDSENPMTFIQWKGTDLCMDFYCPECGDHSHFDGEFAYSIHLDAGIFGALFQNKLSDRPAHHFGRGRVQHRGAEVIQHFVIWASELEARARGAFARH